MTDTQRGVILGICGVLLLSPDALLIRLAGDATWVTVFWRGVLQAIAILTVFILLKGRGIVTEIKTAGGAGLAYALIFGLSGSCFVFATSNTTVANTVFIVATAPIWAAVFGRIFLGQIIGHRILIPIPIVLFGIGLIAFDSLDGAGRWQGDIAAMGTAIGVAIGFTVARSRPDVSMVPMMGVAGFVIAALALIMGGATLPAPDAVVPIALMGLIVVPGAFALITIAARHLPPAETGLIILLEAVFGPLIVWAVLGEALGPLTLMGGAIVLISLMVTNAVAVFGRNDMSTPNQ